MKNQAILTLLVDKQEVLKVGPGHLSPRGCEFICSKSICSEMKMRGKTLVVIPTFKYVLGYFRTLGQGLNILLH